MLLVGRHTRIKDRIQLVAVGTGQVQVNQRAHLLRRVYLVPIEGGLQVVELVRVGFLAEHRGPVVIRERFGDRLRVVLEIEHEYVVLMRVGTVEARERLYRFDAGERLIHIHRVEQRFVVTGLELVRADKKAIGVFLNLVGDVPAGKSVQR